MFKNPDQLKKLTSITGPAIFYEIFKEICYHFCLGTPIVVLDAPTLLETGTLVRFCAEIVVVAAKEAQQIQRVMQRDGVSEQDVHDRLANQMSTTHKIKRATIVL